MDWPARSPDLNLIEQASDMLLRMISARDRQARTVGELTNMLIDEWLRIPVADSQLSPQMPGCHQCTRWTHMLLTVI